MTVANIAGKLGVSESTVEKHLARLKANNIICRVGPNIGGYWKIKSDDNEQ
jgi:predicted HTH transcriptional regulator